MPKKIETYELDHLIECFRAVADPRVEGRSKHLLIDVLVISVCAMLCGAEGISDIEVFSVAKYKWLKKHLALPNGLPSYDTIARVLSIIDPSALERAFANWVESMIATSGRKLSNLSIDGKVSAGTKLGRSQNVLQTVSVYSNDHNLTLVEKMSSKEGGEVRGAAECLELLNLKDAFVTMDAGIGCKEIASKIIAAGGDYLIPLKGSRRKWAEEIHELLSHPKAKILHAVTDDIHKGRGEHRECLLLNAKKLSEGFLNTCPGAQSIFSITRDRLAENKFLRKAESELKHSTEITFYVSSRRLNAQEALEKTREHWGIENKVHWVLDVAFKEDDCGVRAKELARALSLIRKIALNIIRRSKTTGSVRGRLKMAAWNNDFLEEILFTTKF